MVTLAATDPPAATMIITTKTTATNSSTHKRGARHLVPTLQRHKPCQVTPSCCLASFQLLMLAPLLLLLVLAHRWCLRTAGAVTPLPLMVLTPMA
jgi:hypothetical protein